MPGPRGWAAWLAAVWLVAGVVGAAIAESRTFELAIRSDRLPETQRLLRVRQGDEVVLRWTADRNVALHVHGYDLEAKVVPPASVEIRFTATATGRFPIELHAQTHTTIGHLEVHPR